MDGSVAPVISLARARLGLEIGLGLRLRLGQHMLILNNIVPILRLLVHVHAESTKYLKESSQYMLCLTEVTTK